MSGDATARAVSRVERRALVIYSSIVPVNHIGSLPYSWELIVVTKQAYKHS